MRVAWLLSLVLLPLASAGDAVLGCGGFIKASRSIDFSRINVALYSRAGALKYETDCAPNNGYFFIPVYEKGEYVIKVAPPLGWKFSPSEVVIDINGVSDPCTTNQDINFVFDGFGVVGKVLTEGSTTGPAGVSISLLGRDGEEVQKTVTGEDGSYVFTAVPGTDHRVRASHPSWTFSSMEGAVSMTGDNGQAEDLVVAGFDVRGQVVSDSGLALGGVSVLLFGAPSKATSALCPSNLPSPSTVTGLTQLCHVLTDAKGHWLLPAVTPGTYTLRAFYRGEHTEYELLPTTTSLTVDQGSVTLPHFTVAGFSVKGEVVAKPGGRGLEGVTVNMAGSKKMTAVTDTRGSYSIERMESGAYTLTASQDGLQFPTLKVAFDEKTYQSSLHTFHTIPCLNNLNTNP